MHLQFCIAQESLEYDVGSACKNAKLQEDVWMEQRLVLKVLDMSRN